MDRAQITVVVPIYNGGQLLLRQLLALALESKRDRFDLVVVDNRSTDGSAELARHMLEEIPFECEWAIVSALDQQSLGYARNVGGNAVRTPLMCFCDQDDIVAPGWVSAHIRAGGRSDIWTGRIAGDLLNHRVTPGTNAKSCAETKVLGFLPSIAGSNFGVSRELFDRLAGFSESIPSCEDLEFAWRAQIEEGVKIGYEPDAVVHRQYRSGARALYRQGIWYGTGQEWLKYRYAEHGLPTAHWNTNLTRRLVASIPGVLQRDANATAEFAYVLGLLLGRLQQRRAERI